MVRGWMSLNVEIAECFRATAADEGDDGNDSDQKGQND